MAQQTAVDWLVKEFNLEPYEATVRLAKQMEREQIKEAFDNGDHCIDLPDGGWEQKYKSADHYYNETYGK